MPKLDRRWAIAETAGIGDISHDARYQGARIEL
jgi:hypothetical protein